MKNVEYNKMQAKEKEKFRNELVAMQKVTSNYLIRLVDAFYFK